MAKTKTQTIETLERLGLSEKEAELYTLMLMYPQSTVQELTTHSPLPRTMLYHVLNQLIGKNLVTPVKKEWRTVYVAEDPDRLHDLLAERERLLAEESQRVRELIPELKKRYRLSGSRPGVRTFEGFQEYKKALEDIILTKPKMICAYADLSKPHPGTEIRSANKNRRIAKKIQKRFLSPDSKKVRDLVKNRRYNDYTQFRVAEKGALSSPVDLQLYDNKLLYTTYSKREPMAILIEDRALFEMQKNIFDALWKSAQDITL